MFLSFKYFFIQRLFKTLLMRQNQTFRRDLILEICCKLLDAFGINDLDDTSYLTKGDIEYTNY